MHGKKGPGSLKIGTNVPQFVNTYSRHILPLIVSVTIIIILCRDRVIERIIIFINKNNIRHRQNGAKSADFYTRRYSLWSILVTYILTIGTP